MTVSIKEELVQLMRSFHNAPERVKSTLGHTIAQLQRNDTLIPNNHLAKQQVCYFIWLWFKNNPEMMNEANRQILNQFADKIGLHLEQTKQPSSTKRK